MIIKTINPYFYIFNFFRAFYSKAIKRLIIQWNNESCNNNKKWNDIKNFRRTQFAKQTNRRAHVCVGVCDAHILQLTFSAKLLHWLATGRISTLLRVIVRAWKVKCHQMFTQRGNMNAKHFKYLTADPVGIWLREMRRGIFFKYFKIIIIFL